MHVGGRLSQVLAYSILPDIGITCLSKAQSTCTGKAQTVSTSKAQTTWSRRPSIPGASDYHEQSTSWRSPSVASQLQARLLQPRGDASGQALSHMRLDGRRGSGHLGAQRVARRERAPRRPRRAAPPGAVQGMARPCDLRLRQFEE